MTRQKKADAPSAKDVICSLEDQAAEEAYGLGHLAELMELMGECVGSPGAGWTNLETQEIGMRIEYLGRLVKRHAEAINAALGEIRHTAEQMERGGAQ